MAEGFWGVMVYIPLIFILNAAISIGDDGSVIRQEDIGLFDAQLAEDKVLILLLVLYIISVTFYAYSSLQTTKHATAVVRSMFDAAKTLIVWACSLLFGWEKADVVGTTCKLISYVLVVGGTLCYSGLLPFVPNLRKSRTLLSPIATKEPEWSCLVSESTMNTKEGWE